MKTVKYKLIMAEQNTYIVITEDYLNETNIYTYNGNDELRAAAKNIYQDEYQDIGQDFNGIQILTSDPEFWKNTNINLLIKFIINISEDDNNINNCTKWKYVIAASGAINVYKK